jgi:hypothetical protein
MLIRTVHLDPLSRSQVLRVVLRVPALQGRVKKIPVSRHDDEGR